MTNEQQVTVIGAGLAGTEAAWQIASRGVRVKLYEMRPGVKTPIIIRINLQKRYVATRCVRMD